MRTIKGISVIANSPLIETILNNIRRENSNETIINYFFDFLDLHSKIFKYEYNRTYDKPFESFYKKNLNQDNKNVALDHSTKHDISPSLSPKEERDIALDLEKMLSDLESDNAMAFNGEPMDDDDKELLRISLENTMRMSKQMAKKKFTPKKYRKEE